jgi:hypothetical protein
MEHFQHKGSAPIFSREKYKRQSLTNTLAYRTGVQNYSKKMSEVEFFQKITLHSIKLRP